MHNGLLALLAVLLFRPSTGQPADACLRAQKGSDQSPLCPQEITRERRMADTVPNSMASDRMAMIVRPKWMMFSGFDFANGFLSGLLEVNFVWEDMYDAYFPPSTAVTAVSISNFVSGSSAMISTPIFTMSPRFGSRSDIHYTQRRFVGDFRQKLLPLCYPFDQQLVNVKLELRAPSATYMNLILSCGDENDVVARDAEGDVFPEHRTFNLTSYMQNGPGSCEQKLNSKAYGYMWDTFKCERQDRLTINCHLHGVRDYGKVLFNFVVPSVLVSMMSFASFQLHITMAMPRVATTMLAMLTQINLKSALAKNVPGTGELTWMEFYFTIAIGFMFLNLVTHIIAMKAHKSGHQLVSEAIDDVGSLVSLCCCFIISAVDLLHRGCELDVAVYDTAIIVIVVCSIIFMLFMIKNIRLFRRPVQEFIRARFRSGAKDEPSSGAEADASADKSTSVATEAPLDLGAVQEALLYLLQNVALSNQTSAAATSEQHLSAELKEALEKLGAASLVAALEAQPSEPADAQSLTGPERRELSASSTGLDSSLAQRLDGLERQQSSHQVQLQSLDGRQVAMSHSMMQLCELANTLAREAINGRALQTRPGFHA